MQALEPTSSMSNDPSRGEVHFAVSGFWDIERMGSFLRGLSKTALPLVDLDGPIHAFGDMTDFVAQNRETGDAIRDHLVQSRKFGLTRVAIFGASSLVKLQYARLSDGLDVEFFDNKAEALAWLRRPYADAA